MKQNFHKISLFIAFMLSTTLSVLAYDFEVDGIYYSYRYRYDQGQKTTSIEVSGVRDKSIKSVEIPDAIDGEPVTMIGDYAFIGCTSLTSVTIPNTITAIREGAFCVCTSLTTITIPNSVTWLAKLTFSGCTSLSAITLPNSITSIDYGLFEECSSLTSISLPNSIDHIENSAFKKCTALTSITLPNSLTWISGDAFRECTSLTSITLPASLSEIGEGTFSRCSSLTEITSLNLTPPEAEDDSFGTTSMDYDRTLYVPSEALNAYCNAYPWKLFNDIRTIESNSLESISGSGSGPTVNVTDGGIDILNSPEMTRVIISTVDGRVVTAIYADTTELHIPLSSGIYIVKVGDYTTAKVLIHQ